MQINTAQSGYANYPIKAPTVQGATKNEPATSTSNPEEPQKEVHILDHDKAKLLFGGQGYRLFLGRGTPERIFSDTVMRLAKIHDKLGLDWQPPDFINGHTEFEPYKELDELFSAFTFTKPPIMQVFTSDIVGNRLVFYCTFAQMDASAYRWAAMLADARSRLNTDGLAEKLAAANLPEGIDRELLLKTLMQAASEGLSKAEEFVESGIQSDARIFAKRKFRILTDYDTQNADFERFQETVEQLLRKNIESAENIISEIGISKFTEFFSINIVPARWFTALQVENFLKELPALDNTVTLDLLGKEFTRGQLEQMIDRIKYFLG